MGLRGFCSGFDGINTTVWFTYTWDLGFRHEFFAKRTYVDLPTGPSCAPNSLSFNPSWALSEDFVEVSMHGVIICIHTKFSGFVSSCVLLGTWLRFRRTQAYPWIHWLGYRKSNELAEVQGKWELGRYIIQGISDTPCISAMESGRVTVSKSFSVCKHTCRHDVSLWIRSYIDPVVQPGCIAFSMVCASQVGMPRNCLL